MRTILAAVLALAAAPAAAMSCADGVAAFKQQDTPGKVAFYRTVLGAMGQEDAKATPKGGPSMMRGMSEDSATAAAYFVVAACMVRPDATVEEATAETYRALREFWLGAPPALQPRPQRRRL